MPMSPRSATTPVAPPRTGEARSGNTLPILLAVGAAVLGGLLYRNALHNPFVYDDHRLIVTNPALQDPWDLRAVVLRDVLRPVVNLSYAFDTAVWGNTPFGYHLTSVLLHALNVCLVFRVVYLVGSDRKRRAEQVVGQRASATASAFPAALLFAVHPMMSEAVGYITGRSDVVCCSLFLLSFLAGRRWLLTAGVGWWATCVALWAAALLAKETAAMLPFVLLAYGSLVLGPRPAEHRSRILLMGGGLLVAVVAAAAVRLAVLGLVEYRIAGLDSRFVLAAAESLWRYLVFFVYPTGLAQYHAVDVTEEVAPLRIVAVLGILAMPLLAWRLRRVHSAVAFGGAWFVLLLLPSCSLFALGIGEPLAERRSYLAAAGLFLAAGNSFSILWERTSGRAPLRLVTAVLAILFVAQLSLRTWVRNEIWSDPVVLAGEAVALAPSHWVPWMLLGEALRHEGRCDEAIPIYRKVLELSPRQKSAYPVLGVCLLEQRRFDEAEAAMKEFREVDPTCREAPVALGMLAMLEDDLPAAKAYWIEAIRNHPELEEPRLLLAFVDGTLAPEPRRRVCDDFRVMAGGVDIAACKNGGGATVSSPRAAAGTGQSPRSAQTNDDPAHDDRFE